METGIFSLKEYEDETFAALECRDATLEGIDFHQCIFSNVRFTECEFLRCRFIDCTFEKCDLSNLKIRGTAFRELVCKDSKMIGINWTTAGSITHLNFENCLLNYSNFINLDLRKSIFKNCTLREADFTQANLSEVGFQGCDLSGSHFVNAKLVKADFRGAINYTIRPDVTNIKQAKFSLPEATALLYGLDIILDNL